MGENRNAYSEVIEILKLIDDEEMLEKLPMEMLELLKSKANPEYKPQILKDIPLEEQNLQEDTYRILAWISTKYWLDETEVEEAKEIVQESQVYEKVEEQTQETLISKDSEQKADLVEEETISKQNNLPVLYKDMKWYQKIKIKIIEFINRIFKKNRMNKESQEV